MSFKSRGEYINQGRVAFHGKSDILTKCQVCRWVPYGTMYGRCKPTLKNVWATRHKSPRRFWSVSSRPLRSPGDIVLDPFCGCGTAVVAAHRLERKWIGIDITFLAVDLMRNRLETTFPDDFKGGIEVDGEPADEAAALALAERDKFQFQFWAVAKLGGTSRGGQNRKGADQGVDGVLAFPEIEPEKSGAAAVEYKQVIISVKGGGTGPAHVRDLIGTVQNEKAALGVLVTVRPPTKAMEQASASAGAYKGN